MPFNNFTEHHAHCTRLWEKVCHALGEKNAISDLLTTSGIPFSDKNRTAMLKHYSMLCRRYELAVEVYDKATAELCATEYPL